MRRAVCRRGGGVLGSSPSIEGTHMGFKDDLRDKFGIFRELWFFMRVRKKFWLGPIMLVLFLLGMLIVFTEGSALAPFIYTLF